MHEGTFQTRLPLQKWAQPQLSKKGTAIHRCVCVCVCVCVCWGWGSAIHRCVCVCVYVCVGGGEVARKKYVCVCVGGRV